VKTYLTFILTSTNVWIAFVDLAEFCSPSVLYCIGPTTLHHIFRKESHHGSQSHWISPVVSFGGILEALGKHNVIVFYFLNHKSPCGTKLKKFDE